MVDEPFLLSSPPPLTSRAMITPRMMTPSAASAPQSHFSGRRLRRRLRAVAVAVVRAADVVAGDRRHRNRRVVRTRKRVVDAVAPGRVVDRGAAALRGSSGRALWGRPVHRLPSEALLDRAPADRSGRAPAESMARGARVPSVTLLKRARGPCRYFGNTSFLDRFHRRAGVQGRWRDDARRVHRRASSRTDVAVGDGEGVTADAYWPAANPVHQPLDTLGQTSTWPGRRGRRGSAVRDRLVDRRAQRRDDRRRDLVGLVAGDGGERLVSLDQLGARSLAVVPSVSAAAPNAVRSAWRTPGWLRSRCVAVAVLPVGAGTVGGHRRGRAAHGQRTGCRDHRQGLHRLALHTHLLICSLCLSRGN